MYIAAVMYIFNTRERHFPFIFSMTQHCGVRTLRNSAAALLFGLRASRKLAKLRFIVSK